jgi:hypothetical protein
MAAGLQRPVNVCMRVAPGDLDLVICILFIEMPSALLHHCISDLLCCCILAEENDTGRL